MQEIQGTMLLIRCGDRRTFGACHRWTSLRGYDADDGKSQEASPRPLGMDIRTE